MNSTIISGPFHDDDDDDGTFLDDDGRLGRSLGDLLSITFNEIERPFIH